MIEFFIVLWTLELGGAFLLGPAGRAWLEARRARRDFPQARIA